VIDDTEAHGSTAKSAARVILDTRLVDGFINRVMHAGDTPA
jgi:hypothetical protein